MTAAVIRGRGQYVKKASQSFASADAKAILYVFCRNMCVAENTLRGVSVELSAVSGQLRRRTQRSFLEKSGKATFSTVSPRPWYTAAVVCAPYYSGSLHTSIHSRALEYL